MATDQEIRDRGFKYVPQQKYLQNPFQLPEDQEPAVNQGIVNTNAFTNSDGYNYNPYNPDPNSIVNRDYNARAYMKANPSEFFDLNNPNEMSGLDPKQLEGIPGAIQQYIQGSIPGRMLKKGTDALNNILPTNRRAILENELGGQGIMVNSTGQIVSDGGDINTAENIMAGYNAYKVDANTFQKRRTMIEDNLKAGKYKDPKKMQEKLDAINAAEAMMLGTATDRTNVIFDDKEEKKKKKKEKSTILNFLKTKKTADTTSSSSKDEDVQPQITTYTPDGTSGGGAGQGIDISGAGTIRSSDNEFVGDSGPTTKQEQEYGYSTDFGFSDGGRVAFRGGGMDAGAGSDFGEENFGTTTTTTNNNNNNNNNNDNNRVINNPVDISTVTKSVGDYEIPYGLEALIADKGKFQAVLDADDILKKNLGLDFTYDQGPYEIGFNADMEGNKNLGLSYNKGNLSAYANTDFNDPMFGVKYSRAFAYGGLASIL